MRFLVVTVALSIASVGPALADDPGERVEKRLDKGKALFDDLEYAKAVKVLGPVPRDSAATREQRLRALELIGLSHLILGDEGLARDAFEQLLAIDPGYQLRDDSGSPKIRDFFDEVKREYVPGFDADAVAELEHAAPKSATAGRRVEIEATATVGADEVKEMIVAWRRRGVLDYKEEPMRRVDDDERWRARFTPPPADSAYTVDYYIEARNIAGGPIGRVGGPDTPMSLSVEAGSSERKSWYKRWYVIAGGAALVGIGGALLITSGGGSGDGSLPPGRITLTP
jgi:hypothetical protein